MLYLLNQLINWLIKGCYLGDWLWCVDKWSNNGMFIRCVRVWVCVVVVVIELFYSLVDEVNLDSN